MTFATGRAIHKLLAPPASDVTFLVRGFHVGQPEARDYLEQIGRYFLTGLEYGMTVPGEREIAARLETVSWEYRGFAYEGAAMALAVLDGLLPVPGGRLHRFITGPAARQVYTAHVGAGWALARLPGPLRPRVRLRDPLLRWLALDGYGFHEAYFRTPLVVGERRPPRIPRGHPGSAGDAAHVVDQGIGRALWFVCGADADHLAGTIAGFAASRRADLWAGAGLAAAYAGYQSPAVPPGEASLRDLAARADRHLPDLAQGAAFAAKARHLAGLVTPHTATAVRVLCGMEVAAAARCTDDALPARPAAADAYQAWRRRVRQRFAREPIPVPSRSSSARGK
jgi:enediyne biosynthesis protein E3